MVANIIRLIVLSLGLSVSVCTMAQPCNYTLKGVVEDSDGHPLAGATLWIAALQKGINTAADGSYVFDQLCTGDFMIEVKFLGFEDQRINLHLPTAKPLIVRMQPAVEVLHDVVIEGEHVQQHGLSQAVSTLTAAEMEAGRGKALGELLRRLPGVDAIATGPAIFKPVIHGLHSQRILILNNGIRQEGQQWGIEHAPEIDPYIASEIEVVKGAEAVRYGADAVGGVIIINTPALHQQQSLGGEFNLGLMSNSRMGAWSGMLEGRFNRKLSGWGWRVQGTLKRGGDFRAARYNLSNTGLAEANFSGTLGYKDARRSLEIYFSSFNTEIGILRAAHTGNLDDLQRSVENGTPWYVKDFSYSIDNPRQKINHQLLKVKASQDLGAKGRLNILYGLQYNQRKEFDIRRGGRSDRAALSLDLLANVLDVSWDHQYGNWQGSVGMNGTFKDNSNQPGTGIKPLIPDYTQYSGGLFWLEKLHRGAWTIEGGLRYDHQYLGVATFDNTGKVLKPNYTFDYLSASAGVSYHFNPQTRLISNLGIATRPPHVSELYSQGLHHGTASIEEGLMIAGGEVSINRQQVHKEVSHKWINTLQVSRGRFTLEASAYANYIDHYIYLRPTETRLTIRGYFPVFQYQQTAALLTGGDLAVTANITEQLSFQGKYAYLYARDISHDNKLTFIPPARLENSLTYQWPTVGRWKELYISLIIPTTLKQYRAPRTVYPNDVPSNTDHSIFDFMPAPAAYTLINFEVGARLPLENRAVTVSLSGENMTNLSYRNYMNRLRYYADDPGINIMLRVKYNFHTH